MTNPFTQLLHAVLTDVHGALSTAKEIEVGVLGDFNAGVAQIVSTGRMATDTEIHALSQLASAIVPHAVVAEAEPVIHAAETVEQTVDHAEASQTAAEHEQQVERDEEAAGTGDAFTLEERFDEQPLDDASASVSEAGDPQGSSAQVTEPSAGEPAPAAADEDGA